MNLTKIDNGLEELHVWRYWCECTDPRHALEISFDEETHTIQISVISPKYEVWYMRIINAFRVLFGKQVHWMDIMIKYEDRNKIAKIIQQGTLHNIL